MADRDRDEPKHHRESYIAGVLLYDSRVSGNCYKVRLLFAHLGLSYERKEVDVVERAGRLELLGELNPGLRVPTLVLDDGRSLGESDAILWLFSQGTPYLPEDEFERAQVLQWMFFEQYSHEPNIAVLRFWLRFARVKPTDTEVGAKLKGGYAALDAMERHLSSHRFLVAERYTIADIALYAYTHVADEGGFELARYPRIREWLARVAEQPKHAPIGA
jgi:glutathione S-transferase